MKYCILFYVYGWVESEIDGCVYMYKLGIW